MLRIIKSNKPTTIDRHNWIYHDRNGSIYLIHQVYSKGLFVQTDSIRIKRQTLSKFLKEEGEGKQ